MDMGMAELGGEGGGSLQKEEVRRGPWTVDEDLTLINYIAIHGEGRWNSLARSAGLKRTGKSCRLRWLNYLRPDVRRGNITLQEQLLILDLHSRWGNRWSKIAQYLPGRTDNEIKNYWRTRVQKHAKQLKCDVNSKQFKDTMRYLWMPTLLHRIQASSASASAAPLPHSHTNHFDHFGASSDQSDYSFGSTSDQLSPISDFYCASVPLAGENPNPNLDYCQTPHVTTHSHCITTLDPNNHQTHTQSATGDTSDNFWNLENMLFLQHHLSDSM